MTPQERVQAALHTAHLRYQRDRLAAETTRDIQRRDMPAAELCKTRVKPSASILVLTHHARNLSASYYKLFCDHDIPRWLPCKSTICRRGDAECQSFIAKLAEGRVL